MVPGLLLLCAAGQPAGRSFRLGYVAGLVHYLSSLYWLLFIPFPAGAVVGWLALSAYLALYSATWVWLCWRWFPAALMPATRGSESGSVGAQSGPRPQADVLAARWWQRAIWAILCAALWVVLEIVRGRFLSGFPWNFLGVSQSRVLPLIQIASITGVCGVSFLVVWFSVSSALAVLRIGRAAYRWEWLADLRLALLGLVLVVTYGINRVLSVQPAGREITLALVQPSIPQEVIWNHAQDEARFNKIMTLSELALANKPNVLVWPEASMPGLTEDSFRAVTNLIATRKVWMVFGADDAESNKLEKYDAFNAAFLFTPEGELAATYRKQQLVMFGEYVPLARWLPFVRRLIPVPEDFVPGHRPVPFEISNPEARLAVLICFEDVFPHLVRTYVADDPDFLLNLTNDGWFGESAAQWQQAANAVFRAVENGLPLVRCTNNGLTCWIDARGRMQQIFSTPAGNVYGAGFMTVRVPLRGEGRKGERTFYTRHGDWFGWGCVAVSVVACGTRLRRKRQS